MIKLHILKKIIDKKKKLKLVRWRDFIYENECFGSHKIMARFDLRKICIVHKKVNCGAIRTDRCVTFLGYVIDN